MGISSSSSEIGSGEIRKSQWLHVQSWLGSGALQSYSLPINDQRSSWLTPYCCTIWAYEFLVMLLTWRQNLTWHILDALTWKWYTIYIIAHSLELITLFSFTQESQGILKAHGDLVSGWYFCCSRFIIFWWTLFASKIWHI